MKWLVLLYTAIMTTACVRSSHPEQPTIPVRVDQACFELFGYDFAAYLDRASEYWVRRGKPRLEISSSYRAKPIYCHDRRWPFDVYTTRIKGAANNTQIQLLWEPIAISDETACAEESPNWRISTLLIHEVGHMHGVGHSDWWNIESVMHPNCVDFCGVHY